MNLYPAVKRVVLVIIAYLVGVANGITRAQHFPIEWVWVAATFAMAILGAMSVLGWRDAEQ